MLEAATRTVACGCQGTVLTVCHTEGKRPFKTYEPAAKKRHEHIRADSGHRTEVSESDVPEDKPALYFRVTIPDGSVMDTRNLPQGLLINFSSSRAGTPASPLAFTFGPSTPVFYG